MTSTLVTSEGSFADVIPLNVNDYSTALTNTKWLGRCEVIHREQVTYFLDGAHTLDSMQNCRDWFRDESGHMQNGVPKDSPSNGKPYRILVFNCTGEREPMPLLAQLNQVDFDLAIFTTNSVHPEKNVNSDVANFTVTAQREREIAANNARSWSKLNPKMQSLSVECISEAIDTIEARAKSFGPVHVLITGSVHLVGGFISLIHPHYRNEDGTTKL